MQQINYASMKRVAVVGCPGTGKTVFSRKLAEITGLSLIHLDRYYHDKNYGYEHDREAWIKRVEKLTSRSEWIIDGNYRSTFPLRFSRADTIIFLDYPRWRAIKGIYARRFRYHNKLRDDMPEGWREKIPLDFFMFVWRFNKRYRPDITKAIEGKHDKKVFVFQSPREAQNYLDGIISEI